MNSRGVFFLLGQALPYKVDVLAGSFPCLFGRMTRYHSGCTLCQTVPRVAQQHPMTAIVTGSRTL